MVLGGCFSGPRAGLQEVGGEFGVGVFPALGPGSKRWWVLGGELRTMGYEAWVLAGQGVK